MIAKRLVLAKVETSAVTYRFRAENGFGWSLCTINDVTGELAITSDWGHWAHVWHTGHLGVPTLTEFIAGGDVDYLARKLQGGRHAGERFSAAKTAAAIGRRIAEFRLEQGREQLSYRWDDEFPIPPHLNRGRYEENGLPILSHRMPAEYRAGRPWDIYGRPYEALPYLTRDAARALWDAVESVAVDCGDSPDLFIERLPQELYEIVEEPWEEIQHEQTGEDRALRDLVLPALIAACRTDPIYYVASVTP